MPDQPDFKYFAFISYSHRDKKWGDWLHKALETYKVPKRLHGHAPDGQALPKRLFPVFRDREELPTSASLGAQITDALARSRVLIVICSPHAAQSVWVNEEIKTFKAMGREDRILSLIVDGEPNAGDKPEGDAAECFPPALRFRLDAAGNPGEERSEPIAADARPGKDGKKNALLKLAAGLLGVSFDDLKQREHERRVRRLMAAGAVMAVLMALFAGLAWRAWVSERKAVGLLAKNYARLGHEARKKQEWGEALIYYNSSLKLIDNLASRIGISETLNHFIPELATFHMEGDMDTRPFIHLGTGSERMAWTTHYTLDHITRYHIMPLTTISNQTKIDKASDNNIVFSQDLNFLAKSNMNSIEIISTHNNNKIANFSNIKNDIFPMAFSPSSEELLYGSSAKDICIYDINSKKKTTILHITDPTAKDFHFSKNLKFASYTTLNKEADSTDIVIIDSSYPDNPIVLKNFHSVISNITFSPDEKTLLCTSDNTIHIFDTKSKKETKELTEHTGKITSIAFSPDSKRIASGSEDTTIRIWDSLTGECFHDLHGHSGAIHKLLFSHDKHFLISRDDNWEAGALAFDTSVRFWDPSSGKMLTKLNGITDRVSNFSLSDDSHLLGTTADDSNVKIWDTSGLNNSLIYPGNGKATSSAAASANGDILAILHSDNTVHIIDTKKIKEIQHFSPDAPVQDLLLSGDGHTLALALENGFITLHSLATQQDIVHFKRDSTPFAEQMCMQFSSNSQIFVFSTEGVIRRWDVAAGRALSDLPVPGEDIYGLIFSPDGRHMACNASNATHVWDASTGQERLKLDYATNAEASAFSPDGRLFAVSDNDFTIHVVAVDSGREVALLPGHKELIRTITFSPDSSQLASGGGSGVVDVKPTDCTARFWDIKSQKCFFESHGFKDAVCKITFNQTGDIAIASDGNIVNYYDVKNAETIITITTGASRWPPPLLLSYHKTILSNPNGISIFQPDTSDYQELLKKVELYVDYALSYKLNANGDHIEKEPRQLAVDRLNAAKAGQIPWRKDGGKSLVPFYTNALGVVSTQ